MLKKRTGLVLKNEILNRISEALLLNSSFTDNLGLLNGKAGISIFFYHLQFHTKIKIHKDYAGELLDEIYKEISSNTPVNLKDGLTGIGWCIEYLVRNGFVQADTDEVLSDIDKCVSSIRLDSPARTISEDELFSYGHYYISRLQRRTLDDLKSLLKKYKFNLIIDEFEEIINHQNLLIKGQNSLKFEQLNYIIWFFLQCEKLGISSHEFRVIKEKSAKLLHNLQLESGDTEESMLLASFSDVLLNPINHNRNNYRKCKTQKLYSQNNFNSKSELNFFLKHTWYRLIYKDYFAASYKKTDEILASISDDENWNTILNNLNKNNLGLNGLAGIGLGLLLSSND
ncbi:MAG: hypothetical protein ACM3NR_03560 [Methanosarcina sp.]